METQGFDWVIASKIEEPWNNDTIYDYGNVWTTKLKFTS